MQKGKLYMIPNTLGDSELSTVLPAIISETVSELRYFIVENVRNARRFIKKMKADFNIDSSTFLLMDKHANTKEFESYLEPALQGHSIGVISEAGCPGIADPGAALTIIAHRKGIQVVPLVGPSSIFLTLMASGLNGQQFSFHGYLPIDKNQRIKKLKALEQKSMKNHTSHIFIETPYRNEQLLDVMKRTLNPATLLCLGKNITLENEWIKTQTIQNWRKMTVTLHKEPAIFILQA